MTVRELVARLTPAQVEAGDPLVLEDLQQARASPLGPAADRGLLLGDGAVLAIGGA